MLLGTCLHVPRGAAHACDCFLTTETEAKTAPLFTPETAPRARSAPGLVSRGLVERYRMSAPASTRRRTRSARPTPRPTPDARGYTLLYGDCTIAFASDCASDVIHCCVEGVWVIFTGCPFELQELYDMWDIERRQDGNR